ncbi:hypothetical protein E2320_002022, partial [Naja naja]
ERDRVRVAAALALVAAAAKGKSRERIRDLINALTRLLRGSAWRPGKGVDPQGRRFLESKIACSFIHSYASLIHPLSFSFGRPPAQKATPEGSPSLLLAFKTCGGGALRGGSVPEESTGTTSVSPETARSPQERRSEASGPAVPSLLSPSPPTELFPHSLAINPPLLIHQLKRRFHTPLLQFFP